MYQSFARATVEALESRRLLYAVSGTTFNDLNGNGARESGEPALSGWTITLTQTGQSTPHATTTTNANGLYSFTGIQPGISYTIQSTLQPGWTFTDIVGRGVNNSAGGGDWTGFDFAVSQLSVISGRLYEDFNRNGVRETNESVLPNRTVYLDANDNGALDTGERTDQTDQFGDYKIGGLADSAYVVRPVMQAGWEMIAPADGAQRVTFAGAAHERQRNFGLFNTRRGSIFGKTFYDLDRNGVQDFGEHDLVNKWVYLDLNENAALDSTEPRESTSSSGSYQFDGLAAGTYLLRLHLDSGWMQTSPADNAPIVVELGMNEHARPAPMGQRLINHPYGSFQGILFDDADGDGEQDPGELPLTGRTVYLDTNNNGVWDWNGSSLEWYTITDGQGRFFAGSRTPGTYRLRHIAPPGWEQTAPADNGSITLTLAADQYEKGLLLGQRRLANPASISGTIYNDIDRDATRDGNNPIEPALPGRVVFLDLDGDGFAEPGEPQQTTPGGANGGTYRFDGLPPGTYRVRTVLPDAVGSLSSNWVVTQDPGAVTVAAGEDASGRDIGTHDTTQFSEIRGTVYIDANNNGVRDTGETAYGNLTVYVDANNNGALDTGELRTTTGTSSGNYTLRPYNAYESTTYHARVVLPSFYEQTAPVGGAARSPTLHLGFVATGQDFGIRQTGGTIAGMVYNDADLDGVLDPSESRPGALDVYIDSNNNGAHDAGEPIASIGNDGRYVFGGVDPGTYHVRVKFPAAWTHWAQTNPPGNAARQVQIAAGTNLTNVDFGVADLSFGAAALTIFRDTDADGVRDAGEIGWGNVGAWVDLDGDGGQDFGEPTGYADNNGLVEFARVPAGTHKVRVLRGNWRQTTPAGDGMDVTITAGQRLATPPMGFADPASFGTISGFLVEDLNGNGLLDRGENYSLANRTVYIDANNNAVFDAGERSFVTQEFGGWRFDLLPTGTHRIRQVLAPGWKQTAPVNDGALVLSVTAGQFYSEQVLATAPMLGTLTGRVFNDADADAFPDANEVGVASRTVYLDINNDGVLTGNEPAVMTDGSGVYTFAGIAVGQYTLRTILPSGWRQTSPANGQPYVVQVTDGNTVTAHFATTNAPLNPQAPYNGSPFAVGATPVTIEAEHFDLGGQDVAYFDNSTGNGGGTTFRSDEDVDLKGIAGGGYRVLGTYVGEWVEHTIDVAAAGTYTLDSRVSSKGSGGSFHIELRDAESGAFVSNLTGAITIPNTGGHEDWVTLTHEVTLPAGTHVLRLAIDTNSTYGSAGNFDWMTLTQQQTDPDPDPDPVDSQQPYTGSPFAVGATPVTIQAEHYDLGGEGVAYHDLSAGNGGAAIRTSENVDMKLISGDNYRIHGTYAGEWVEYTIDVATSDYYTMEYRVSSKGNNGLFHVEQRSPVTGEWTGDVTGSAAFPNTGDHNTFQTIAHTKFLAAGRHVLRFAIDQNSTYGSAGNLDWIRISPANGQPPQPPPPGGTVTVNNTVAAYVRDGAYGNKNYGNIAQLIVKGSASAGSLRESYLKFDISTLPSDPNAITNVKIRLYGKLNRAGSMNVGVFSVLDASWVETGITFNNKPPMAANPLSSETIDTTASGWHEWDITDYVKQARQNGSGLIALALKALNNTSAQAILNSDDAASNKPQLVAQTGTTTTPPQQALVVSPGDQGLSVPEGGSTSFTVKLAAAPTSDVTVTISKQAGSDPDVNANKATLTFTPANWNVAQTVTLSAAEDADSVNNQSFFSVASPGLTTFTVWANEADNDGPVSEPTVYAGTGAYVRDGTSGGTNYGTANDLYVKQAAGVGSFRETYIKFDLTSADAVTRATLRLNGRISDTRNASITANVLSASDQSWTETGLTWNNKPAAGPAVYGAITVTGTSDTWYQLDLTGFVQAEFAAGRKVITLVLRGSAISQSQILFASDETANGPQLIVA